MSEEGKVSGFAEHDVVAITGTIISIIGDSAEIEVVDENGRPYCFLDAPLAALTPPSPSDLTDLRGEVERLREALRVIRGPEDRGPWILIYRKAGGGYEGLQAIARAALGEN